MRRLIVVVVALIVACSSSEEEDKSTYSGDALAKIESVCNDMMTSAKFCPGSCTVARLNSKCPEADPVFGTAEMKAYLDCVNACPIAKQCQTGRPITDEARVFDCACVRECAAGRKASTQGYLAHQADCTRKLPECF